MSATRKLARDMLADKSITGVRALANLLTGLPGASLMEAEHMGDFAIELAVRNWEVFPLRGKTPAIPNPHRRATVERKTCKGECGLQGHGVLDATSDIEQVAAWWFGRYRGANIGARPPESTFVLDTDPRNGGRESLFALLFEHGRLPPTLTA